MRITGLQRAARQLRAVFFSGAILATGLTAHAAPASPPTPVASPATHGGASRHKAAMVKSVSAPTNPSWAELSPAQQQGLAPLEGEWDKMDSFRKNKWLAIGNKFDKMKPEEQQRLHERMREWVKLTPEQRRMARENYARVKKLNPDQKSARWQQYQQLPEEQKKKLAADAAARKHGATVLPSTQGKHRKTLPPIKASPKRMLENSVTPQPANPPTMQPSLPPEQH
jgi:membrane protein involved in colicin uptake